MLEKTFIGPATENPCQEYLSEIPFHSEHSFRADHHGLPTVCEHCGMQFNEYSDHMMAALCSEKWEAAVSRRLV